MATLREIEALTTACYDAALGQISWGDVLARMAAVFDGTHATLLLQQGIDGDARVLAHSGFETSTIVAYEQYYKDHNVLIKTLNGPAMAHLRVPGVVRTSEMLCTRPALTRTEYYNGFLQPIAVNHLIGTTIHTINHGAVHVNVFQPQLNARSLRRHLRALAFLAPHLQRAMQVHERLGEAQSIQATFEDHLERIERGAGVLGAGGALTFANQRLRGMLSARDGVMSAAGGLTPMDAAAAKRFRRAVTDAAAGGPGGRLALPRPSGAPPYHVLVSPLASTGPTGAGRRGVLVLVSDPASPAEFDAPLLREIYGLTAAECQVACHLANGLSVEALADRMGIAPGTVRTHLKRTLQKTRTHRQADLVRLLLLGRTLP